MDGVPGGGNSGPFAITGRTFQATRVLPTTFGPSIRRIFPIQLGVRDDDLGTDRGVLNGTTYWSFQQSEQANEVKDLATVTVQQFSAPSYEGTKWKGYGEAVIHQVTGGATEITGSAKSASALAFPGLLDDHDFTKDLAFRAASALTFSVSCDPVTGVILPTISGGGGGPAIRLDKDGNFLGWNPGTPNLPQNGPLGTSSRVSVVVTPAPGSKLVQISVEAKFGLAATVTITDETSPQIDGPGGRITFKRGTSSSYSGGLQDFAHKENSYSCVEQLSLTKTDLAD
jgi:hypothetical protein